MGRAARRLRQVARLGGCAALAVLLAGWPQWSAAGLVVEPVSVDAAVELAVTRMEAAHRQATYQRLAAALGRIERERRASTEAREALERELGQLSIDLADLDAAATALMTRAIDERQEVRVLERRLAGLLAEIVQLSRDEGGDHHRLAQLRAVAAGLARPFADAKASLAGSEQEQARLQATINERQRALLAAEAAHAEQASRAGHLDSIAVTLRSSATIAASRASLARQASALSERRVRQASVARGIEALRPTGARLAGSRPAPSPRRLEPLGLVARAAVPSPSRPGLRSFALGEAALASVGVGTELVPVAGVVVGRFREGKRPLYDNGIMIAVDDRRLVRAPRAGEVVFAGRYAGFGLLLIIDHGGEYHSLLSGLSRLVVDKGWKVQAGQMVGTLEPQTGDTDHLYVELRRSGVPVDPLSWFAAGQHKVRS